jgi:hypothetical protein
VREFLGDPMTANDDGSSVKVGGRKLQVNGSDVLKDRGNDKANRNHREGTASLSPLKIMLTSDNTASSWSINGDMDNRTNRPILLEASIIEVSGAVLTELFL